MLRKFRGGSHSVIVTLFLAFCSICVLTFVSWGEGNKSAPSKKPRFEHAGMLIRDNRTGLFWPVNGSLTSETFSWTGAYDYIGVLNNERFAGKDDWRLPTKEELLTLVEFSRSRGYDGSGPERSVAAGLRATGFSHVRDAEYWSSTTSLYDAAEAWFVNLLNGTAGTGHKELYLSVWPVRSGR